MSASAAVTTRATGIARRSTAYSFSSRPDSPPTTLRTGPERRHMADVQLTWLGHATFRVDSPGGKRIYIDPWLTNPKGPESEQEPERVDIMAITHGHGDHLGEAIELGKRFKPEVIAIIELATWLEAQGVEGASTHGMNKGGTV